VECLCDSCACVRCVCVCGICVCDICVCARCVYVCVAVVFWFRSAGRGMEVLLACFVSVLCFFVCRYFVLACLWVLGVYQFLIF